jgi:gliding motility-associated-like protein
VNTQPATPGLPTTDNTRTYCQGATSVDVSSLVSGGAGAIFTYYSSATITTGSTTAPTPSTANAGPITYYVSQTINGCESARTPLTITIVPTPIVTSNTTSQSLCSGSNTNITLSSNVPGVTYNWSVTTGGGATGAISGSGSTFINQNLTLPAGTNEPIEFKYVVVAEIGQCKGPELLITVIVNPIPNVTISGAPTAPICSGETTAITLNSTVLGTTYSWQVVAFNGVSGFTNGNGNSIINTLTTTGLSQGSVTYNVTPTFSGCIGTTIPITVTVNPRPTGYPNYNVTRCSGISSNPIVVNAFSTGTIFNWTMVRNGGVTGGASSGNAVTILTLDEVLTNAGNNPGTAVYTITPVLNGCSGTPFIATVTVNPAPKPKLTNGVICIDQATGNTFQNYVFDTGLSGSNHTFVWSFTNGTTTITLPGNGPTYEATQVGNYSVIATNTVTSCVSGTATATITSSSPATGLSATVSQAFTENSIVTVTVVGGTGSYMYQLGDGALQTSNVFENVPNGVHIVKVIDTQGCTYLTTEVTVINFMPFFTPNGDGYNDTWKIGNLKQDDAKIYIYDKYGKLLKQISGGENANGWDGTYNGQPMPGTDYWFTVTFKENNVERTFKAHFGLKR